MYPKVDNYFHKLYKADSQFFSIDETISDPSELEESNSKEISKGADTGKNLNITSDDISVESVDFEAAPASSPDISNDIKIVNGFLFLLGFKYTVNPDNLFLSEIDTLPSDIDEIERQQTNKVNYDDLITIWMKLNFIEDQEQKNILQKYILPVISFCTTQEAEIKTSYNKFKKFFVRYIYKTTKGECSDAASIIDPRIIKKNEESIIIPTSSPSSSPSTSPPSTSPSPISTSTVSTVETVSTTPRIKPPYPHLPSLCRDYKKIPTKSYCDEYVPQMSTTRYHQDSNCLYTTNIGKRANATYIPRRNTVPDYCNIVVPDDVDCEKPMITTPYTSGVGDSFKVTYEQEFDYTGEADCWQNWLKQNATVRTTYGTSSTSTSTSTSTIKPVTVEQTTKNTFIDPEELTTQQITIAAAGVVLNVLTSLPSIIAEVKALHRGNQTSAQVLRSLLIIAASVALSSAPCLAVSGRFTLASIMGTFGHFGKALSAEAHLKQQLDSLAIREKKFGRDIASQYVFHNAQADCKARLIGDSVTGFFTQCAYIAVGICDVLMPLSQTARLCTMLPLFMINSCGGLFKFDNAYDDESYNYFLLKKTLLTNFGCSYIFQKTAMIYPEDKVKDLIEILKEEVKGWNHIGKNKLTDLQELDFLTKFFDLTLNNADKNTAYMVLRDLYNYVSVDLDDKNYKYHTRNLELKSMLKHIQINRNKDKGYKRLKRGVIGGNNIHDKIISIIMKALAFREGIKEGKILTESIESKYVDSSVNRRNTIEQGYELQHLTNV